MDSQHPFFLNITTCNRNPCPKECQNVLSFLADSKQNNLKNHGISSHWWRLEIQKNPANNRVKRIVFGGSKDSQAIFFRTQRFTSVYIHIVQKPWGVREAAEVVGRWPASIPGRSQDMCLLDGCSHSMTWICLRCLEKIKKCSRKWWFNGDLPLYKVKNRLKQIQDDQYVLIDPHHKACSKHLNFSKMC